MFIEFFAASVERENLSVCADKNRAGDAVDSIVNGNRNRFAVFGLRVGNDRLFVKHLFPGNLIFLEEFLEFVFLGGIVTGNADDLKSLVVISGVRFFDVWKFAAARTAPSRPEVNQNDFAGVIFGFVFGTVNERSAKFEFVTQRFVESLFAFGAEKGFFQLVNQLVDFRIGSFRKSGLDFINPSFRGFVSRQLAGR